MKDLLKKILSSIGLIFAVPMLGAIGGQGPNDVTFPNVTGPLLIGRRNQSFWNCAHNGYLDEIRISKGIARWTGNFTPPTLPYAFTTWLRRFIIPLFVTIYAYFLLQNWWVLTCYLIGSWVIILIWGGNSWRGYGEIPVKLFGKTYNLLIVDLVTYATTSCGLILIINGWLG